MDVSKICYRGKKYSWKRGGGVNLWYRLFYFQQKNKKMAIGFCYSKIALNVKDQKSSEEGSCSSGDELEWTEFR